MRTLIYTAFVSLDGVVQAPAPEADYPNGGWTFQGIDFLADVYELKGREQQEASALMLGRVSYQAFAPVWPKMTEEFPRYNAMPKYVVSTTLGDDDLVDNWGDTTILRSFDDVAALKETEGGPISIHGSASLARGLSDAGLLDRYHLLVFPWVLGAGKRMWSETAKDRQKLELVESQAYANGVQKLCYSVAR
ncbi:MULTISPECIES: dihydrofolate reductase family protein [unclassified Nocardioides]|uniref:dihydrofolate reductase family protein n=1 Tax=unclassified Nocardioides TaxID=2615069 RepID=UPI000703BDF0|nr:MULTISPECIES: dihydrofolate reductase family protein [unclassified Nocardioides]KRC58902.1 deaminase [Nocardioides sp. Root79]KRC76776.1 deaminase [Nocardioides sp. Root240]